MKKKQVKEAVAACAIRGIALASLLLALPGRLSAGEVWEDQRYVIKTWKVGDGLPFNRVEDVVQRRNGFVWVATLNGAARFDGVEFEPFNKRMFPMLPNNRVSKLHEDRAGNLFLGHATGHVTIREAEGFRVLDCPAEWTGRPVTGFREDETGSVWALAPGGRALLVARNGVPLQEPEPVDGDDLPKPVVRWEVVQERVVRIENEQVAEDRGETPWVIEEQPIVLLELANGDLAAGSTHGGAFILRHSGGEAVQITAAEGLASSTVLCLAEDAEGLLWVGTTSGLQLIRPVGFRQQRLGGTAWKFQAVRSIAPRRDGGVWIGTNKGNIWFMDEDGLGRIHPELHGETVRRALLEDSEGALWFNDDEGFLLRSNGRKLQKVMSAKKARERIWVLHEDRNGVLWAGGDKGLWNNAGGRWHLAFGSKRNVAQVRCMAEATDGTLWIGMEEGGLASLRDDRLTHYGRADGLPNEYVTALCIDKDADTLWIGSCGNGLAVLSHGRILEVPLGQLIVSHILDDGAGRLWVVGEHGVAVVDKAMARRAAGTGETIEVHVLFGKEDGFDAPIDIDAGLSTSCQGGAGCFWFAADRQVATFYPEAISLWSNSVPLRVTDAVVNESPIAVEGREKLGLAPGVNRLDIHFAALSHGTPTSLRFRCRMKGIGEEWIDLGSRRFATFQRLPPGSYRFELTAANRDGVWNREPLGLDINIQPHYWETWWFKTLCYSAGVGIVAFISLSIAERMSRKRLILAEQAKAVEQERTRIAMDIHDEIGSELTRMQLLCHKVQRTAATDGVARALAGIGEMDQVVRKLVFSLDEIVWVVSPGNDNVDNMVGYLAKYVSSYLRTTDIRPEIDLPLELPLTPVPGHVRHNLFLAVKEAVNNIVKHSDASKVVFSAAIADGRLTVRITDNGKGLDSFESERFKRGLRSMRRRMDIMKGQCDIRSNEGGGTTAEFMMPIPENIK
ncbi:Sensor histidine kinase LiaS [Pontiella desulfatans]|uniref:Sensor histidine kinase LiaS n=1 Tax=Pontiella desulfatans TaxID=2750659 RepID=A0A6C2U0B9_PONDE|nr:sensor histidine kinase [Pontiella desulfatans]VGO13315.1 Sensor histidine kinase LiaS [Pontiella desulfatans]